MRPKSSSACVLVAAFVWALGAATACILNPQPQPPLAGPDTNAAEPSADASAGGTFHIGGDAGAQVDAGFDARAPIVAADGSGPDASEPPSAVTDAGPISDDAAPVDDADAPSADTPSDSPDACDADGARTFEPRGWP